ncbi:hypothetical protein L0Z72_02730 [candidate division KSB1 bacterium]|nr:hypothetical protein [candidate division KSB1 bacterium]
MTALIIQLLSGAVGGNIAGSLLKKLNLGTLWNSVVGILGGGLGGQILSSLGLFGGGEGAALSLGNIIGNIASSGVGGGVLLAIVGLIKNLFAKK